MKAPPGVDGPAINAVILAGLQYLALREKSVGSVAGVDIQSAEGRARIAVAVEFMTNKVYAVDTTTQKTLSQRKNINNTTNLGGD